MPPALVAPRRSPLLARALLLGACALGLAGLAGPAHHPTQRLSASSAMATSIEIEPRAPHTTAAVVVAQRASRSRTVRPAKRVRRHVVRWVAPNG